MLEPLWMFTCSMPVNVDIDICMKGRNRKVTLRHTHQQTCQDPRCILSRVYTPILTVFLLLGITSAAARMFSMA